MTLLRVDNLSVAFGAKTVVDNVSFTVARGEVLALVGESGSGKSLSALSILRLLPPGATATGAITLDNRDVLAAPETALRQLRGGCAGMVFQEPMTSLNPLARIGLQIAEAIKLHQALPKGSTRARVAELLAEVGFSDAAGRLDAFPHQLSGGQRQRVMIAMALANDPKLLIADEPTTALDVTIQAQILKLLAAEKSHRGLALLLISHDLAIVRRYADRVAVMRHGRIVETGPVAEVFTRPAHPYTIELLAAEPSGHPPPLPAAAETLIEADHIKVHFPIRRGILRRTVGHVKAVDDVSLVVHAGETVALVGESGSGKSTLGYALAALQDAEGAIRFRGETFPCPDRKRMRRLRAELQIVFQDPFGSLSPRMSVAEIIAEGLAVHASHLTRPERDARVAEALREVGLPPDIGERFPHEFSGGQRQRIAIARAIVLRPRFLVLDEPTSALDMSVQAQIVDLLRRLQLEHGLGYLFISHDLRVVRALAHRVIVLRQGRVMEEGPAETIFAHPTHPYTQALMAAAFNLEADESGVVAS
jgi:microcin C transport system ATP-binding protein